MPGLLLRAALVAGVAGLAAACQTTPSYPVNTNPPSAPPMTVPQPAYPIRPPAEGEAPQATQSPQSPPLGDIESSPLTPVAPPASVESGTVPPLPSAPAATYTPPPVTEPEPAPPPKPVTRTVTETTVKGKVVTVPGKPVSYEVKKGDNLYQIAKKLDTTVEDLAKDNKLKEPYRIQPGDTLKGPATTAKAYVVGDGDTLFSIAKRFSVTAAALADANDLKRGAAIKKNQKLILPDGYKDKGPIKRTTTVTETPPAPAPRPAPRPTATVTPTPAPTPEPARPATPPATVTQPARPTTPTPAPTRPATTPTPTRPTTPATPPASAYPYNQPAPTRPATTPATPPAATPTPTRPTTTPTPPTTTYPRPSATTPPAASLPQQTAAMSDAEISAAGQGRFVWPLTGDIISTFGPKGTGRRNDGIDIRAAAGAPVRAAASGQVVYAGDQVPGFGNLVLIKHDGGWVTAYAHLGNVDVKMQQRVSQGQQIGEAGATGGASENQLHFEVRYAPTPADKARPIDPRLVLPR